MLEKSVYARTRVRTRTQEKANATTEISKAGIYTVGIVSALIGLWGLACFVGGIAASGGPLSLVGNWFKSISGM
jgi:small-conductance mechanosensitive channel